MAIATYTKTGTKASTPAKLDKKIFGLEVKNHQLLKDVYLGYLANGRTNLAKAKLRGEVRGGGRKPHVQKGTGRARAGSIRSPLWVGGGVTFGPTGSENFSRKISLKAKRQALRQALSLAVQTDKIKVIDAFAISDGKVKSTLKLLSKLGSEGNILLVVEQKDEMLGRATKNLPDLKVVSANYLTVFDVLNSDSLIMTSGAVDAVEKWLGEAK